MGSGVTLKSLFWLPVLGQAWWWERPPLLAFSRVAGCLAWHSKEVAMFRGTAEVVMAEVAI